MRNLFDQKIKNLRYDADAGFQQDDSLIETGLQIGSAKFGSLFIKDTFNNVALKMCKPFNAEYKIQPLFSTAIDSFDRFNEQCYGNNNVNPMKFIFYGNVEFSVAPTSAGEASLVLSRWDRVAANPSGAVQILPVYDKLKFNGLDLGTTGKSYSGVLFNQINLVQTGIMNPVVKLNGFLYQLA